MSSKLPPSFKHGRRYEAFMIGEADDGTGRSYRFSDPTILACVVKQVCFAF